jgi:hypothetical protein
MDGANTLNSPYEKLTTKPCGLVPEVSILQVTANPIPDAQSIIGFVYLGSQQLMAGDCLILSSRQTQPCDGALSKV